MTSASIKQLFPRSSFVGFDHIFDELDRIARHSSDTYPPHNVVKNSDTEYQIELAVAGFSREDIDIAVEDRTLTVSGAQSPDTNKEYIHKGISEKKFVRNFRLSEYVEVIGADLKDGILAVGLKVVLPDEKRPRKIEINDYTRKLTDGKTIEGSAESTD